jgi:CRP-like cAMP-binding protein
MGHLFRKLQNYARLSHEDRVALDGLRSTLIEVQGRQDIISEGDNPKMVRLIVSGWACSYKGLPDGRRQIVGFFIPGDFCDLNVYILKQMAHSIAAITPVRYAAIPPEEMERITHDQPRIGQALWWHELVNSSIQREWLLNVGQRTAYERIAHLLVELFVRLQAVGMADEQGCDFPITQIDIAEATGLTSVHVNRTLRDLRSEGLIGLTRKRLLIPDRGKLKQAAMFNSNYLHLDHEGRYLDANN